VPELPEVETVVRDLRPLLTGHRLTAIAVSKKALRKKWRAAWHDQLIGQRVLAVERRGKWIFLGLDRGWTLVVHLGMTGQLTVVPAALPRAEHTHVVFTLDDGQRELRFRDIRRFGSVTAFGPERSVQDELAAHGLGPEPFHLEPAYWKQRLQATRRCVKAVLLDQRVVAGVGNIYADESLFAARLHPARLGRSVTTAEAKRLAVAVPAVLLRAIDKRGSSIRDYIGGSGLRGEFQEEFCVYGRTDQPCVRCRTPITLIRLAGRSTHFCPRCQKKPKRCQDPFSANRQRKTEKGPNTFSGG
jgi:formamidopyrimidine-DNA glycosylase